MSMSLFWLIVLILFGILEAVTVGLASIWFAAGALVALLSSIAHAPIPVQIVTFLGVSFLTLLLVRPLARRYVNDRKIPTNADRAIGQIAVVTQEIRNLDGRGQVSVSGSLWTARAENNTPIPEGANVRILAIEGVKLLVAPIDDTQASQDSAQE